MNIRKSQKLLNALQFLYAPVIVMGFVFVVFIMKGVYPFGSNTVDCWDMAQCNVPSYYHLYDAMRGAKSLFFDWYTGTGINMAQPVSTGGLLSPFNLFFYFVKRENILYSLSIFTTIKMMAASLSMYFFLHKKFKVNIFWKVSFSVCYVFSGFVLQYYSNNQWLDIVAIFPLLISAFFNLTEKKRILPYTIILAALLIINLYSSIMILMFLFFAGGLYFVFITPKSQRGRQIWLFGLSTVSALGLSAVITWPAYKQISMSARASGVGGLQFIFNILEAVQAADMEKWCMLFGTALAMAIIIKGIITGKNKKATCFVISCILTVTLQILFENINLIWHAGSYVWYPMRFGYMVSFVALSAACYYISGFKQPGEGKSLILDRETTGEKSKDRAVTYLQGGRYSIFKKGFPSPPFFLRVIICITGIAALFSMFAAGYNNLLKTGRIHIFNTLAAAVYVLSIGIYFLFTGTNKRRTDYCVITVLLGSVLLTGAYVYIAPNPETTAGNLEISNEFIGKTEAIKNNLSIEDSSLDRIKNIGNTLNANYPFILKHAGLSNYTHSITDKMQQNIKSMGYSVHYTRLLDSGGSVFTDALLNVKQTLSTYELNESLYFPAGGYGTHLLYKNRHTLPFGIAVPDEITRLNDEYTNPVDYQNAIFEAASGESGLMKPLLINGTPDLLMDEIITMTVGDRMMLEYDVKIEGRKALYFYPLGNIGSMYIDVDNEEIAFPSVGLEDKRTFPSHFNSQMVCLGAFEAQTVNILFNGNLELTPDKIGLAILDIDKLESWIQTYDSYTSNAKAGLSSLSLTVTGSEDRNMLFLPMTYDKGWSCTVNGQKTDIEKAVNSFIGIKLENGINDVRLHFTPDGMVIGIVVSLTVLILLITGVCFRKRLKLPGVVYNLTGVIFLFLWGAAVLAVYIIPMIYTVLKLIFRF